MYKFSFLDPEHSPPLLKSEVDSFLIKPRPLPSKWIEENINLIPGAYTNPGPVRLKKIQQLIVDLFLLFSKIIIIAPTQEGKSLIAECLAFYAMSILGINGKICYAENKTAEDVFKVRIRPMIEGNACLRMLWNGKDDNLTIDKMVLKNSFWSIASAQNKNSLATFPAGFVVGAEVGKWERMAYNPVHMLLGRQESYDENMRHAILETSAYDVDDYSHQEVYGGEALILRPHVPCPHCGVYQVLEDSQIKLRPNADGSEPSHDPVCIRFEKEKACFYECINCKQEIEESHRYRMEQEMILAAPAIEEERGDGSVFKQEAEKLDAKGKILTSRKKYKTVAIVYNRLTNINFPFYECLARFFASVHDPEKKKVYDNETMARYSRKRRHRIDPLIFESRKGGYLQKGDEAFIPDEVLMITAGFDTQGPGYFGAFQGWGPYMSSYILRHDFFSSAMGANIDKEEMLRGFVQTFFSRPFVRRDGRIIPVTLAFIDRGGHRADDVDFLCSRLPALQAYIGLARIDPDKPLVRLSDEGNFYLGQSEVLSENVGALLESDNFYIPDDTGYDFINQIGNQFHVSAYDKLGGARTKWIKGRNDHYRSCLNMSLGAAKFLGLDHKLFSSEIVESIRQKRMGAAPISKKQAERPRQYKANGGGYFNRALGARR